jgi:hypothetical protein
MLAAPVKGTGELVLVVLPVPELTDEVFVDAVVVVTAAAVLVTGNVE